MPGGQQLRRELRCGGILSDTGEDLEKRRTRVCVRGVPEDGGDWAEEEEGGDGGVAWIGTLEAEKGIYDLHSSYGLAMVQILGQQLDGMALFGSCDDHAVPEREAEAFADFRSPKDCAWRDW